MSNIITDSAKIKELLERGVDEVIDKDSLAKELATGRRLRVKLGIDPTSPRLHLGRSIPLLKLKDFQELGHQIIFIVGDFTGVIGDTSDKDSERPMLSPALIKQNMKDYVRQAGKIINLKKCEIKYNSQWLKKLTYDKTGEQADQFSLAEFMARENIKKRLDEGRRVSLREVLYPLMQGYDSVAIRADVELGGTDQRFNLLAGRRLQEYFGQKPQNILMTPLMEGTDGRKMSSSWGNTIDLTDEPAEMFGKVMSITDDLIIKYFTLATRAPSSDLIGMESQLKAGANPRDVKARLAREIVKMYHGDKAAETASAGFDKQFKEGQMPEEMETRQVERRAWEVVDLLAETKLANSKSEARRLLEQGGVKIDGKKITSVGEVEVKSGMVISVGKRKFVRIR